MHIKSGTYRISSASGRVVGRRRAEDHSTIAKGIVCPTDADASDAVWGVERLENKRYKLFIKGDPAGNLDGKLYAFPSKVNEESLEWYITPHHQHDGLCSVTTASDATSGWVAPRHDAEDAIVDVAPLVIGSSDPPQYPKNELWHFKRLE